MKKMILVLFSVAVLLCVAPALSVSAAETDNAAKSPSNVTITVVMPEPTPAPTAAPTPPPTPAPIKVYPTDVKDIRDDNGWQIVKTYELNADEKPGDIPRDSFERQGWRFTLTDIIRHETANAETREHTETVTLNTDTKEIEKILPLLSPTMEYKADDGFVGIISLDVASIKVETAGTKTSNYTMSVTREYPRLSANDTSLVPKTVVDRGTTYKLAGVEWKAGNTVTVDYEEMPEYYTAVATYTATGTSTKVTGYVTTAVYTGTLARMSQGKTVYTAYFLGEEIRIPLEMTAPAPTPTVAPTSTPTTAPTSEPTTSAVVTTAPTEKAASTETSAPKETTSPTDAPLVSGENNNKAGLSGMGVWLVNIPISVILAGCAYYFMKRKGKHNEKTHDTSSDAAGHGGDGGSSSGG